MTTKQGRPSATNEVETDALTEEELRNRIRSRNAETLASLERQLRSPLGVIPFVGAGMSATVRLSGDPPEFPQWRTLLSMLAEGRRIEAEVKPLLELGDYERAASKLDEDRPGILPMRIRDAFDREVAGAELLKGPLSYLPFLATGPVITTNFDRILEQVFAAARREFRTVISGPLLHASVAAVHTNEHALLKIHGDCRDPTFRVFTVDEYELAYGGMQNDAGAAAQGRIGSLGWLLFTNRPLLFLGCSLERDRTVHVLRSIRQQLPGLTHYAVMVADRSPRRWEERERHLDGLGVRALWYAPGQFKEVEELLCEALERASTRPLAPARPVPPSEAGGSRVTMAEVAALLRYDLVGAESDRHSADLRLMTRALKDGRLAFFLGAYASLEQSLLGNRFYDQLARKFDCPLLAGDRTAVASFISSRYGHLRLWQEVRSGIEANSSAPSVLHRLIAALPVFLRERETPRPLWIFTTNYDTLMEQAMTEAGEAFYLLYYANDDGEDYFIERSLEGALRCIEMPENLRHLGSSAHVIVKFDGGLSYYGDIAERVSIERVHFERLAARIPAILPGYIRTELRARSLLFLGHGLAEPHVHALIKYAYTGGDGRTLRSWAVQLAPADAEWRRSWQERASDWQRYGLKILDKDLKEFTAAFCQQLISN